MRYFCLTMCFLGLMLIPGSLFSQQVTMDHTNSQNSLKDGELFENYLDESRKLAKEFATLFEQLINEALIEVDGWKIPDYVRWEKEYYQPLFENSRQAMARITGTDDYLEMWENKIPQKIVTSMTDWSKGKGYDETQSINIPYGDYLSNLENLPLSTICTLAICCEHRDEILKDTEYEDSERGGKIRDLRQGIIQNPWAITSGMGRLSPIQSQEIHEQFKRLNMYFVFPLRFPGTRTTFDNSWHTMAIYSFKNDRARDLLFEMATCSDDKYDPLADWAIYYLSLFPNSGELLPKVNNLLDEAITIAQQDNVNIKLFYENDELTVHSLKPFNLTFSGISIPNSILFKIWRLLTLKRSLEFNEKIPVEERERFDAFRRELAISWSLCAKRDRKVPEASATLQKGDEHFEIYFLEYGMPGYGNSHFPVGR